MTTSEAYGWVPGQPEIVALGKGLHADLFIISLNNNFECMSACTAHIHMQQTYSFS